MNKRIKIFFSLFIVSFLECYSTTHSIHFSDFKFLRDLDQKNEINITVDNHLNNIGKQFQIDNIHPKKIDAVLMNGKIAQYENDSVYYINGHLIIKNGKIKAITKNKIKIEKLIKHRKKFGLIDVMDLKGAYVYPGFIDAHAHFLHQGIALNSINLLGTKSWEECIERVKHFVKKNPNKKVYRGQGWDQNDWELKEFPNNSNLESITDKPIILSRIDGHAILANSKALKISKIDINTEISGGEIIKNNENLTGLLIDNAQSLLTIQEPNNQEKSEALLAAQEKAFQFGLTGIHDAGLPSKDIMLIDTLQRKQKLKIPLYIMVSESEDELNYWLNNGPIKTKLIDVRSFKFYSDGALGSRGALMRKPYSDRENHFGSEIRSFDYMLSAAERIANNGWQMNTHCIGDSANRRMLNIYQLFIDKLKKNDLRWRIEHAQVVHPKDRIAFGLGIIPSVQPSHATSDMNWAINRLGPERILYAYSYLTLREVSGGILPLGTDFPVESMNPLNTFYSAIYRKSMHDKSQPTFQIQQALSREQALIGMTRDPAYASFQENEVGQIKIGMWANFTIFTSDILKCPQESISELKVLQTWVHGELVYMFDKK
jgi:predicted amidohydrolase YtcJ